MSNYADAAKSASCEENSKLRCSEVRASSFSSPSPRAATYSSIEQWENSTVSDSSSTRKLSMTAFSAVAISYSKVNNPEKILRRRALHEKRNAFRAVPSRRA